MFLGKFTIWVLKEIINKAEEEWYNPQIIQQEFQKLQTLYEAQEITQEEYKNEEKVLFERLLEGRERRSEGE